MFSIINKSVQSDPILINDFSRIAPLISNKLNGTPNPGCSKPKLINIAMADQRRRRNVESASTSNSNNSNNAYSRIRPVVSAHLQRVQNKRKQDERRAKESINLNTLPYSNQVINPVHLAQHFHNFNLGVYARGQPLYQNPLYRQYHNNALVYRNFSRAVLEPNLNKTCFHSRNQENQQRQVQSATSDVGERSMNGLRFWEQMSSENGKSGFVFSVMSYNVLAQDLIDQHLHLYTLHTRQSLEWHIRWNNLLSEIRKFSPDILCLQEVQGSHLREYFSSLENLGYRGLYKQRTGIRTDGCAIYYKLNLVTLIEYTTVEYNQPNVRILDRDNVAIIAKFAPRKHPSKEFVVATTHLLYNPKRQDVRLAQTQLLLTELERIAFTHGGQYLPVIITGDWNSTPDSVIYQFITKGKLKYENLASRSLQNNTAGPKTGKHFLPTSLRITDQCQHADLIPKRQSKAISRSEELKLIELRHSERRYEETKNRNGDRNDANLFLSGTLTHKFFLKSVYDHVVDGDFEGTTYQDEWISVDYIFYSEKKANLGKLTLLERFRLPTRKELGAIKIPNKDLGSDHLSLFAKFKLDI